MKILVVLSQLNGHGGIPRFNRNLVEAIGEHNHSIELLSLNDASDERILGANRNKALFFWYFMKRLATRPDVVLIGHINLLPLLIAKSLLSFKSVVILHGIDAWSPKKRVANFYKYVDEFWSVSHYTKSIFNKVSGVSEEKIKRIFNTLPSTWEIQDAQIEKKFFLTVTRVDKSESYKGIDKTIEAISRLKEKMRREQWSFKVVLSGDDVERHIELVKKLQIEDLVHFNSNVDDTTLAQFYKECAFFIMPSSGEGFGIVFLEAMSNAKACIGALGCGTNDVIDHERTGFLLNQEVSEIEKAIQNLISDSALRKSMGREGLNKLNQEFSFNQFSELINQRLSICVG